MGERITPDADQEGYTGQSVDAPLLSLAHNKFASTSTGSMELVGLRDRRPAKVSEFETQYRQPEDKATLVENMKKIISKKRAKFSVKKVLASNFPIVLALRRYKITRDLPSDVVSGLTSGIMMIPQEDIDQQIYTDTMSYIFTFMTDVMGMAFASLSTLQPIIGLYISLFSSLTYFLLGTGQQSSFGCIAILSIMMGAILDKYETRLQESAASLACGAQVATTTAAALLNNTSTLSTALGYSGTTLAFNDSVTTQATDGALDALTLDAKKLQVAGSVTLLCGIIFVVLGKVGLGRVTIFMSDSLVTGFTVGAAFHIGSSQLKTMFGLSFLPRQNGIFKLLRLWYSILSHIDQSNVASIIASAILILVIYLVKRFVNEKYKDKLRVPIPIELIAMIVATVIFYYADLYEKYDISIIKEVPVGVPTPHFPDLSLGVDYLTDGLVIIIVAFVQTVSVAKLMGLKHSYKVDPNQEMFAVGMVNVVCAVFSGYISGASVSRSVVQDSAGGKSQIASLFAAVLVLLVMLFMGPYFYHVPKCSLSAIIILSLRSLILKLLTIPDMWRKSKVDCIIFVTTILAVVILDADIGLLVGVVVSIFLVLFQSMMSSVDVTTHITVGELGVWRSRDKYYGDEEMPNVRIVRINSPLYFVNTEITTNAIFKKSGVNPLRMKKNQSKEVDAKTVNDQDKGSHLQTEKEELRITAQTISDGRLNGDVEKELKQEEANGSSGNICEDENVESVMPPLSTTLALPDLTALPFSVLILDLSGASFVDLMGVKSLEFLIEKYKSVGVSVYLVNVTERCLNTLQTSGFMGKRGEVVLLSIETVLAQLSGNPKSLSTKL